MLLPNARIEFDPGMTPTESALTAARCDVAIVFGVRVESEGFDSPTCHCHGVKTP
jgi:beta-glucosidase